MNQIKKFNEVKIRHLLIIYVVSNLIGAGISLIFNPSYFDENYQLTLLFTNTLMLLLLLYKFKISKLKIYLLFRDFRQKLNIKEIFSVVTTQICFSIGSALVLISVVYYISPSILNDVLNNTIYESSGILNNVISFLLIVIVAPISEELIFRAIIFKRLSIRKNVILGILVSSVIFGLLHIELAVIGAIAFGVANCILYIKYKNILIPITVHFVNNFIRFIPQFVSNGSSENVDMVISSNDITVTLILGLGLLIIGTLVFRRFIKLNKKYLKGNFNTKIDIGCN